MEEELGLHEGGQAACNLLPTIHGTGIHPPHHAFFLLNLLVLFWPIRGSTTGSWPLCTVGLGQLCSYKGDKKWGRGSGPPCPVAKHDHLGIEAACSTLLSCPVESTHPHPGLKHAPASCPPTLPEALPTVWLSAHHRASPLTAGGAGILQEAVPCGAGECTVVCSRQISSPAWALPGPGTLGRW